MDISRDAQAAARTQRLEDRNTNKERTESLTNDMEYKKYWYVPGASSDTLTSSRQVTPGTAPDSFAPPAFSGTNADADKWLANFQRYIEYRQLLDKDVVAISLCFCETLQLTGTRHYPVT